MSTTTTQYGVIYPDGSEDWDVLSWFGRLDTPQLREDFRTQYRLRCEGLGVPANEVSFATREVTTSYSVPSPIVDTPELDPAPEEETVEEPVEEALPEVGHD